MHILLSKYGHSKIKIGPAMMRNFALQNQQVTSQWAYNWVWLASTVVSQDSIHS